jgi:hypothetical protein
MRAQWSCRRCADCARVEIVTWSCATAGVRARLGAAVDGAYARTLCVVVVGAHCDAPVRQLNTGNKNVTLVSNPATFIVDGVVIGVVAEDIVRTACVSVRALC